MAVPLPRPQQRALVPVQRDTIAQLGQHLPNRITVQQVHTVQRVQAVQQRVVAVSIVLQTLTHLQIVLTLLRDAMGPVLVQHVRQSAQQVSGVQQVRHHVLTVMLVDMVQQKA